jgi:hypothetical protein
VSMLPRCTKETLEVISAVFSAGFCGVAAASAACSGETEQVIESRNKEAKRSMNIKD